MNRSHVLDIAFAVFFIVWFVVAFATTQRIRTAEHRIERLENLLLERAK